ncbi:ABC transporter permease [Mastigocoleus testarum]|uniref:ABC transporter permease n=1 Tax=Mastigocoleus testarum BC008 TaxID=371196 RepID=A0A0V7ZE29_9CYAN|nr:ABC transporter permease [Mastigocoleus testarum]KST62701.1 ABC transporter permease [Mastigocoleus testarum BC008]
MSAGRIFVLASNVFKEVVRERIFYIIGFYGIILLALASLLPELAAATEHKMFPDFGLAAMSILGLIVAVFVGTGIVNKEIEKRTILMLIAKPVSRTEFVIGKYLGLIVVLTVLIAVMTAIFLSFLHYENIDYSLASIFIFVVFLLLQLSLITAVALALSIFTNQLLATALTFAVYLMGNISQDILELGRTSRSLSIERLTQALYLVVPDLSRLDFKDDVLYGLNALPQPQGLLFDAGYSLLYCIMILALTILIFSQREF